MPTLSLLCFKMAAVIILKEKIELNQNTLDASSTVLIKSGREGDLEDTLMSSCFIFHFTSDLRRSIHNCPCVWLVDTLDGLDYLVLNKAIPYINEFIRFFYVTLVSD